MRKYLGFIAISVFCFANFAVAQNPYESLGVKTEVLTLSKGKYNEFFDNDTIVQIGSVLFNTNTNELVGFIAPDTTYSEATFQPEITSRWLSPDPLSDEFPSYSPYNYVLNNPIRLVDPDGRAPQDGGGGDDPFLIVRLVATMYYDTKHSLENIVMNTFVPNDPGMKWQSDYATDANGNQKFETVIQQVPSAGALRDGAGLALDAVNVVGAGKINANDILSAKTGTNQVVREGKEILNSGRGKNHLKPYVNAQGDHSTFKTDPQTGKTTNYATYEKNSKNPSGFQEVKRVDVTGKPHGNVPTPHVKETGSKQVRSATKDELPRQ